MSSSRWFWSLLCSATLPSLAACASSPSSMSPMDVGGSVTATGGAGGGPAGSASGATAGSPSSAASGGTTGSAGGNSGGYSGPTWQPPEGQLWSDPATWGGAVPADGADVTIPLGKTVILDVAARTGHLMINGTLACAAQDVSLAATEIMVMGRLECGAEDAPFAQHFELTLLGTDATRDMSGAGTKVLMAMGGGAIELHGLPRSSWTRIARTSKPGGTQLQLEKPTDWRPGDRLVVASTDFDMRQAEERVITQSDGSQIELDKPLEYLHWGEDVTYHSPSKDFTLSERAEVGLVNRNILIHGDAASDENGFGGHIMIMSGGVAHVSDVELTKMGQRGILARYPFHWHLAGDVTGQYLRNSSIHHTFSRCATIHGSDHAELSTNLCYDNVGHAIFLEDGVERFNLIEGNLALLTRKPDAAHTLIHSDSGARGNDALGPASYWITNPDNTVRNNVAAGSDGSGFWYPTYNKTTGLSTASPLQPNRTPLGVFEGNVIHSTAGMAMVIGGGDADFADVYQPTETAVFRNSVYYKTRARGVWAHATQLRFENFLMADNVRGAFFSFNSSLVDSLIVGESPNLGTPTSALEKQLGRSLAEPKAGGVAGYVLYDGPVVFQNVHFAGFSRQASNVYILANNGAALHHMNNRFEGVSFAADTAQFYPEAIQFNPDNGQREAALIDVDGKLSGRKGSYLLPDFALTRNKNCEPGPWSSKLWLSCLNVYGVLRLQPHFAAGSPKGLRDITVTRSDGVVVNNYNDANDAFYQIPVISNQGYRYKATFASAAEFPVSATLSVADFGATDGTTVMLEPVPPGATFTHVVAGKAQALAEASSAQDLDAGPIGRIFRAGSTVAIKLGTDIVSMK